MDNATKLVAGICGGFALLFGGWIAYDNMPERPKVVAVDPPKIEPPVVAPVPAKKPPKSKRFDFKGDTLGTMTVEQFRTKYPDVEPDEPSRDTVVTKVPGEENFTLFDTTIAGAEAISSYTFFNGRLCRISVHVRADSGSDVLHAIRQRYGDPAGTAENDRFFWETDASRLEIEKSGKVVVFRDKTVGAQHHALWYAEFTKREAEAAKDL